MHEHLGLDMRDGVMYVTPSGRTFNKEIVTKHLERLKEAFQRIATIVQETFGNIVERLRQLLGIHPFTIFEETSNLKNFAREHNRMIMGEKRKGWHIPKSIMKPNQALNRKPQFSYIRNNL